MARRLALALGLLVLAGCASAGINAQVQRAFEGPTSEEIFRARFVRGYARVPTFDESNRFRDELEERIREHVKRHPELLTSPRLSQLRFHQRVAVGMPREEIVLLLGQPDALTSDATVMEAAAKTFWPVMKSRAKEMWAYPTGWMLYFDGDLLTDITVTGQPPL